MKGPALVLRVSPCRDYPELPVFSWRPFLGFPEGTWQVFGAAAGGLFLARPSSEEAFAARIKRAAEIGRKKGYRVRVRRTYPRVGR